MIDIRPDHWMIVRDILRRYVPGRGVWAFGSRARWTAKAYSDLDLAVMGDRPLTLSETAALADAFSDSDLPFRVDVVDWATTRESFRDLIQRHHVVVQAGRDDTEQTTSPAGSPGEDPSAVIQAKLEGVFANG